MRNTLMRKPLAALILALSGAGLAVGGPSQTPAGTVIENRATLDYQPEDLTLPPRTVITPPVKTVITAQCRPSVLPDGTVSNPGQVVSLLPGESGLLRYTLANSGNTDSIFTLSAPQDPASAFPLSDVNIYADYNGSGQIDSGEGPLTSVQLKADQVVPMLVSFKSAAAARGAAYLNLVAACPANEGGAVDNNNIGKVQAEEPPVLSLTKAFGQSVVRPSQEVSVSINAANTGLGTSREVIVTDRLDTPDMIDFRFVSGSASTSAGTIEYTADGNTWATAEPGSVRGVRVRIGSLLPGGILSLNFRLVAPSQVSGSRTNIATLQSLGFNLEARATVEVRYTPKIALGPVNNPEALPGGELSSDDLQTKPLAFLNREICFQHTVKNLGDVNDTISISGQVVKGSATIRLAELDGSAFQQSVALTPGASKSFAACYTPTSSVPPTDGSEALRVLLTATSAQGAAQNQTVDVVTSVTDEVPQLVKSVSPGGVVKQGVQLTYTLKIVNPLSVPLTNVVVTDQLDPNLDFVSADSGGALVNGAVIWKISSIAPKATVNLTLVTQVKAATPDDTIIKNSFTMVSSEFNEPLTSNEVSTTVFGSALIFNKTSSPAEASIGDTITYTFTVTNPSKNATFKRVEIVDTMPIGIQYVPGSSRLDGTPIGDPAVDGQNYTWIVSNLGPGQTAAVTFEALVSPKVGTSVTNTAIANAISSENASQNVGSQTTNRIRALIFEPLCDLVGSVFIDVNRNGTYDKGLDIPMVSARVILANGRTSLTDTQGRYHFATLKEGFWALRLDPSSVYAQNLSLPQDGGLPGSRGVMCRQLTSVDFPLASVAGDIGVIRDTTLKMGSFTVHKQVFTTPEANTYLVQLTLSTPAALGGFTLQDPLPTGATLLDGQNALTFDPLPAGSRAVTYRFRFGGDQKAAVTDPTAEWRY
ncbi:DUF11 domain-containing protein [Deinococcus detaillensis]|uniref:DUF11 domain-containing protein n=1 Tax=Deinococcus detaillensis TaxID=2592048 RepID=A0A553V2S5_9DEIO|nr:isopeptide-forming domain-containing fimbrial protein [Deinococcus detaillensis]TSA86787.1 DUF11 domain-containing protein [Deinococcus detaillensis]